MREREGSILGTSELKKLLKIDISFLFVITQHIKELSGRKFSELLRIICQVWGKIKFVKFFKTGSFINTISKVVLVSRPLPIFPKVIS